MIDAVYLVHIVTDALGWLSLMGAGLVVSAILGGMAIAQR